MPADNLLILGFQVGRHRAQFDAFMSAHGLSYDEDDAELLGDDLDDIQDELKEAHAKALEDKGFQKFSPPVTRLAPAGSLWYRTPLGPREFSPFSLGVLFDTEGDEKFEDYVVGVSIISRYRPTFADWRNQHGSLIPIVFDDELQADMDAAKKAIASVLPEFKDAYWIVKEIWY